MRDDVYSELQNVKVFCRYNDTWRWSTLVVPSSRRYMCPWKLRKASSTSSILVICVNMRTRWFSDLSFRSRRSSDCSLPQSYWISLGSGNCVSILLVIGWYTASFGDSCRCSSVRRRRSPHNLCGGGWETWNRGIGARTAGTWITNLYVRKTHEGLFNSKRLRERNLNKIDSYLIACLISNGHRIFMWDLDIGIFDTENCERK